MADTPKTPQQGGRSPEPQKQRPKVQAVAPAVSRPPSRKRLAHHEREVRNQRRVVITTATAIGLALLAVIIGLSYDQLWLPSRPVAQVGTATLSRRDYWQTQRLAYARQIAQNFQLVALFGGNQQFTQQFANQSPQINSQVQKIRTSPVDDAVVNQWQTLQIKEQGAAKMGISVSDGEINQAVANDMGQVFIPPPVAPITSTATISGTVAPVTGATSVVSATATAAPTATKVPTIAASPTPGGPTVTPEPTSTTKPTPQADEAATQLGQIVDEIYRRYEIELVNAQLKPILTKDDFRATLISQFREQVINTKVQESLVSDQSFVLSSEPKKVKARQILIAVSLPTGATQEQIDALFKDAKGQADSQVAELRAGASFVGVATAISADPGSAKVGGDIGLFDKNGTADNGATYPPELVKAAFGLALNTVSDPIRSQFGWHIIEVTERQVPTKDEQLRDARTKALDTWLVEQRAAIATERFPAQTPSPTVAATPSVVPIYEPGPPTQVPTPLPTLAPTVGAVVVTPAPAPVATKVPAQPTPAVTSAATELTPTATTTP